MKTTEHPHRAIPIPGLSDDPNRGFEIEVARRRAEHNVHDAARILSDALYFAEPELKPGYMTVIRDLQLVEERLGELQNLQWSDQ